jgi:CheY-like chemotaxis protein
MIVEASRYFSSGSHAAIMLASNPPKPFTKGRHEEVIMSMSGQERILVVDDNHIFRETLAQRLRDAGYHVVTAETGERAFVALRDWTRPVDWLYARANLPGLIGGSILADEYHDRHAGRAVIIAAPEARSSRQGDIILKQPTLATVLDTIQNAIEANRSRVAEVDGNAVDRRRAA